MISAGSQRRKLDLEHEEEEKVDPEWSVSSLFLISHQLSRHKAKINAAAAKCSMWAVSNGKKMKCSGCKAIEKPNTVGTLKQCMLGVIHLSSLQKVILIC